MNTIRVMMPSARKLKRWVGWSRNDTRPTSGFVLVRNLHDEATMHLQWQLPAAPAAEHGPAAVPASRCVHLRCLSSKIPTLIIGVSISITIMIININISIASSYLSVSSVGG